MDSATPASVCRVVSSTVFTQHSAVMYACLPPSLPSPGISAAGFPTYSTAHHSSLYLEEELEKVSLFPF